MAKVAVASSDGVSINEHFARADKFFIYEIYQGGEFEFIETREVHFNDSKSGEDKLNKIVKLLGDVKLVLASSVGSGAVDVLHDRKIVAVSLSGSIERALESYAKRGKILEYLVAKDTFGASVDRANCPIRAAKILANVHRFDD
ncbi:NifB/NifX family molybdenum-iron cluster-binding protein [Clostridium luticellarii]|jgi:nitrogen fixation protein NifB|uniref:Dinitrogenase iron-molybdenum cofactor n=1 Tax=Clostridium luticellarii TaxID=1691940 RepID=A0A2T0BNN9_9CLOT|nr:NifB/NifX family molybdenum-iron cluster-binding protein [Clostridium luticellarii]MCI1944410.1 NifB/NifX family molybdenum-iron cluster-binding protein [Clostridium luticellarii]MCI1969152.1 NifB/NifX family molybdenum-iron cluster-binding protein [Clostridium luticellarii]MCI1995042.1 NifB/NifX family molybdenum-iron cluster-binding protein [Clostridium luticellarii]MCI2039519.1 NifB/NifX family molybdenum-iron cluster-binding protein [Clostridium luticellarii]PRR85491.1 Dinitrogenase iro